MALQGPSKEIRKKFTDYGQRASRSYGRDKELCFESVDALLDSYNEGTGTTPETVKNLDENSLGISAVKSSTISIPLEDKVVPLLRDRTNIYLYDEPFAEMSHLRTDNGVGRFSKHMLYFDPEIMTIASRQGIVATHMNGEPGVSTQEKYIEGQMTKLEDEWQTVDPEHWHTDCHQI